MPKKNKLLWKDNDWTFEKIKLVDEAISEIAKGYGIETYRNQIEIISSEQMLSAYASSGMPVLYGHWSYGKQFVQQQKAYKRGQMGLAFEIVINSNPCIAYLMEENTMTMQMLVIAHACYGHNSFFKNNYLFQQWTDADSIVDYLVFARNYIRECEEKYGENKVEELLDSCHALMNYGVDRYTKPKKLSIEKEKERQASREEYRQQQVNDIWKSLPPSAQEKAKKKKRKKFPKDPTENILYFVEKNAPLLKPWQREIVRIVRKIAQYFYPQRQTQVMNEGWATFWHHRILNDMFDQGLISEGAMLEFIKSHSGVIYQAEWDNNYFNGINVYTLGYNMYRDIKRICEEPTDEDKHWFPEIAGSDWVKTFHFAMKNFKDESFILQYLSPKLIRDLRFFTIADNENNPYNYIVSDIHDDAGYKEIRTALSEQYNLSIRDPDIQVYEVDKEGDRTLFLRHYQHNKIPLNKQVDEVLKHLHRLWGFRVVLDVINSNGKIVKTYECSVDSEKEKK